MLALGPPMSLTVPRKAGSCTKPRISCKIAASLRLTTRRPWCRAMAQKAQPPAQPRWATTEKRTWVRAGTGAAACSGCTSRVKGRRYRRRVRRCLAEAAMGFATMRCPPATCVKRRPGCVSSRCCMRAKAALSSPKSSLSGSSWLPSGGASWRLLRQQSPGTETSRGRSVAAVQGRPSPRAASSALGLKRARNGVSPMPRTNKSAPLSISSGRRILFVQ